MLLLRRPGPLGSCSPVCTLCVLCCICCVLGLLTPVHRCASAVCCVVFAPSLASWLLFSDVHTLRDVLLLRCPGPLGSCSPVCKRGVLCCVCGVVVHIAPVHRSARSVCRAVCAVPWATWLLFTGVYAPLVELLLRCPGPPGSCSPVCTLDVLCCARSVLGDLVPVHQCARAACCVACAVSRATWHLFTGVWARRVVLCVRCSWPLGACSPLCRPFVLCCLCGLLGNLAPVHPCVTFACRVE